MIKSSLAQPPWKGSCNRVQSSCYRGLPTDQINMTNLPTPRERRTAAPLADDGGRGAPLELGPLDLVFGEAALATDLITAFAGLVGPILTTLQYVTKSTLQGFEVKKALDLSGVAQMYGDWCTWLLDRSWGALPCRSQHCCVFPELKISSSSGQSLQFGIGLPNSCITNARKRTLLQHQ